MWTPPAKWLQIPTPCSPDNKGTYQLNPIAYLWICSSVFVESAVCTLFHAVIHFFLLVHCNAGKLNCYHYNLFDITDWLLFILEYHSLYTISSCNILEIIVCLFSAEAKWNLNYIRCKLYSNISFSWEKLAVKFSPCFPWKKLLH